MELCDLITEEQKRRIVNLMLTNDYEFSNITKSNPNLFYSNYAYNRNGHQHTYAIISAFKEETKIDGMRVREIKYGLNSKMSQPELYNDKIIIHIYNKRYGEKSDLVKEYCKKYNSNLNIYPVYAQIEFSKNKLDRINKIELQLLDEKANVIDSMLLYVGVKLSKSA